MTLQQAIDAPRLSVIHATGSVSCEGDAPFIQPAFSIATQNALRKLGHVGLGDRGTDGCQQTIGSVQAIAMELASGIQSGAADPRREGTVIQVKTVIPLAAARP